LAAIFGITFPIYAAIAIGYALVRFGGFTPADMRLFGKFVMIIAMPALMFSAMATRDFTEIFQMDYALAYLLGGLATIAAAFAWFRFTGIDPARRALAVMGSTCPNSGFVGYPVMLLAFPEIAGVVLALNVLIEIVVLIPVCLVLIDLASGDTGVRLRNRLGAIFLDTLKRPMVIALFAGLAVSLMGLPIPGPLERLLSMLASAAAALSLIAIGGALVGLPLHGNRSLAAQIAVGKLLLHPALVALVAALITLTGVAALPPDLHVALILSAAMPMFGIYVVLAQEQCLEGAASLAMLTATSGAFVTLNALLYWLI
jgi:malonate transporter and related proteins